MTPCRYILVIKIHPVFTVRANLGGRDITPGYAWHVAQCKQRILIIANVRRPWRLTYKTRYLINNVSCHPTSATGTLYKQHHNTKKYKHLFSYDYRGSPTYTKITNTVSTNTFFGLCTCKWGN